MPIWIQECYKAFVTAIGVVATAIVAALGDDIIDLNEWGSIGGSILVGGGTVYAVWRVRNRPPAKPLPPPPPRSQGASGLGSSP